MISLREAGNVALLFPHIERAAAQFARDFAHTPLPEMMLRVDRGLHVVGNYWSLTTTRRHTARIWISQTQLPVRQF
jgi:hypothetical protein